MLVKDFESIGVNLIKSLKQFVLLEAELERELVSTKGWLKKSKLDELTGIATKDKIEKSSTIRLKRGQTVSSNITSSRNVTKNMSLSQVKVDKKKRDFSAKSGTKDEETS